MPVPDYQTLMLPILKFVSDEQDHTLGEAYTELASVFSLTEEEIAERQPSGQDRIFVNRVRWSVMYLRRAGLLVGDRRGILKITSRGLGVLKNAPSRIDDKFLAQFPEFVEFKGSSIDSRQREQTDAAPESTPLLTPEDAIEAAFSSLTATLAQDLLDRVKTESPTFFEGLVLELLISMGYGGSRLDVVQAVGGSGDGGVDGIIKEDRLGLDLVYVQAKRWENTVGRPVVQAFAGSLEGFRARKGILITTSNFSRDAKDYVGSIEKRIVLIDGLQLADLMIEFGIGVTETATYALKRIDNDYFESA